MSGAHLPITEKLIRKAREEGIGDKMVIVGGVIPTGDIQKLKEMGVKGVFPGGAPFKEIVEFLKENVQPQEREKGRAEAITGGFMGVAKYTKDDKDRIFEVEYPSGINVKTVYGPKELERVGFSYEKDLADPGDYPFTRGIHREGYRSRAWTMRQYSGFGTAAETNERFKFLISTGPRDSTLPSICLPRWATTPMIPWLKGRWEGWAWPSTPFVIRDRLRGDRPRKIGASLTVNAVASIILAMYQAMAEKLDIRPTSYRQRPKMTFSRR